MVTPTAPVPIGSSFHLVKLFAQRLSFTELVPPASGVHPPEPGQARPVVLDVDVLVGVTPDGREAQTTFSLTVTPDPNVQPYRAEVVVTAVFRADEGLSTEEVTRFARKGVPVILFPFVREMVHRLTVDGRYGLLRLDPVNVGAMLEQSEWREVTHGETPAAQLSASSRK